MNKIEIPKEIFEQIFFKEGGEKKESTYKDLTGQFLRELPENSSVKPNAEIEKNEYVQDTSGIKKAEGETHENGGIQVALEDGARVLSDHLKVGKEFAKSLSKEYDIKVKPSDTYAKVLDKYLIKIKHTETTEELEENIKKLDKQKQTVKDETTLALNQEYLNNEINEYGEKLDELEPQKEKMFNLLYFAQEEGKKSKEKQPNLEKGGTLDNLASKYGIDDEKLKNIFQKGGNYYDENNPYFATNPGGIGKLKEWINSQMFKVDYKLGDLNKTAIRLKDLADNIEEDYTEEDFKDLDSLNNFSGKIQKKVIEKRPEVAYHYGLNVDPTQKGLQYLVDNNLINPKDFGIKIINGKVSRGSYDTFSEENKKNIQNIIGNLDTKNKKRYSLENFYDNLGYFRGTKVKEKELSEDEYNRYINENKGNQIGGGYFKTDVPGVYVKPKLKGKPQFPENNPNYVKPKDSLLPPPEIIEEDRKRQAMLLLPDQSPLRPPSILAPAKFTPRIYGFDYAKISPEQQLSEINRSQISIQNQLSQLPDNQRAATLASMDANNAMQVSKVVSDVNRYNAQAQERTDANASEVRTRQSIADMDSAARYQDLMGRELGAYDVNLQNYYNRLNANQLNNWLTVNEINRGNALNEDIKFTGQGFENVNPYQISLPKKKRGGRFKK